MSDGRVSWRSLLLLLMCSFMLPACGGGSDDSRSTTDTGSTTGTGGSGGDTSTESDVDCSGADADDDKRCSWVVNDTDKRSANIYESDTSNTRALVNVQSVTLETVGTVDYVRMQSSGVPDHEFDITQDQIDWLNARPKAATDFKSGGATTATAGDTISFGEDINYKSNVNCPVDGGDGYWPPGPECPEDVSHDGYFTESPTEGGDDCEAGLGPVGFWVNGTSIYQWGDGQSYHNQDIWHTLAPVAEVYDVDLCGGHAAEGDYHHHFYSTCLADLVGDDGSGHSPLYGYAADGYPIYGPYQSSGVYAKPSWVVRDYDTPGIFGCGTSKERSCVLDDEFAPTTTVAATAGPDTDQNYMSLSGNTFVAEAGFFYEDYYYDDTLPGSSAEYLDVHNGHSDGTRGYHYHVTIRSDGVGGVEPAFPYTVGPNFYGELPADNNITQCGGLGPG